MDYDDKDLVIFSVMVICIIAMVVPNLSKEAVMLAEKAFYGLFGIAIGKGYKKGL